MDISIRNAKYAKIGLRDLLQFIGNNFNHSDRKNRYDIKMVEIGSYVGDSTKIFANQVSHITCIDPWRNGYDENDAASYQHPMETVEAQFDKLLEEYKNIRKLKMTSKEASEKIKDGSLDFVYIDGLHTREGVAQDIELWLPKVRKGGFVGGHDYASKHHPGVKVAVDEAFGKPLKTFRDSSWVVKIQ